MRFACAQVSDKNYGQIINMRIIIEGDTEVMYMYEHPGNRYQRFSDRKHGFSFCRSAPTALACPALDYSYNLHASRNLTHNIPHTHAAPSHLRRSSGR